MAQSATEHLARWHEYYSKRFLPWDSRAPASQLVWYLQSPCVCALLQSSRMRPGDLGGSKATGLHRCTDGVWLVDAECSQPARPCRPLTAPCPHCAKSRSPQGLHGALTALELCCGTGASVVHMAQAGFHAVGIDAALAAVEACHTRAKEAGVRPPPALRSSDESAGSALFLCGDVLALPQPLSYSRALELNSTQNFGSAETPSDKDQEAELFDFVYDCQSYHVLRQVDEQKARALLTRSLRPGGVMMMLVGARDPTESKAAASTAVFPDTRDRLGPPQMTVEQLTEAFTLPDWEWQWLVPTRFDITEYYREKYDKPPLAWWCLLKRA